MARPAGRRNADFEEKRLALARAARASFLRRGTGASLREIAEDSGTSLTNLRHYFGDRDRLFTAVLEVAQQEGAPWLDLTPLLAGDDAAEVLGRFFELFLVGWRHFGVGRIFELGLAEGMGVESRGTATVNHLLEPTLVALEGLLGQLVARGALPAQDLRVAALSLLSPVLVALLHQDCLYGRNCRELDIDAFVKAHLGGWLKGHGPG